MSWLFVAFIPALLMLATFGLDRLEAGLVGDAVSPADVDAVLEQAKVDCARPPAAIGYDDAVYERLSPQLVLGEPSSGSPARMYAYHRANPEFRPTWQADRV